MPSVNMQVLEESRRHQIVQKYEVYPLNAADIKDYQIELTGISSSVKEDARIIQDDLLNQWVELKGSVWSKLDNLKAKTPQTVLGLSGDLSSDSVSDGDATFDFFDDFELEEVWNKYSGNPVLSPYTGANRFDTDDVYDPFILKVGSEYWMYYTGSQEPGAKRDNIGLAISTDLINWTRYDGSETEKAIVYSGGAGDFDVDRTWLHGTVIRESSTSYKMWYIGDSDTGAGHVGRVGYATSSDGKNWTKYNGSGYGNSIFQDFATSARGICSITILKEGDTDYKMIYCSFTSNYHGTDIRYATSPDGISWTIQNSGNPVISGNYLVNDMINISGTYYLWVTDDGLNAIRLFTSTDLISWTNKDVQLQVTSGAWDATRTYWGRVFEDTPGVWRMFYAGIIATGVKIGYATLEKTLPIITKKWNDHGGTSISNGILTVQGGGASWSYGIASIQSIPRPNVLEMRWKDDTSGHNDFGFSDGGWDAVDNVLETFYIDDSENINTRDHDGSGSGAPSVDTGENAVLGTWYNTKIEFLATGAKYYWGSAGLVDTTSTYSNTPGYIFIDVFNASSKVSCDWVFVRKYITNEPIIQNISKLNRSLLIKYLGSRL